MTKRSNDQDRKHYLWVYVLLAAVPKIKKIKRSTNQNVRTSLVRAVHQPKSPPFRTEIHPKPVYQVLTRISWYNIEDSTCGRREICSRLPMPSTFHLWVLL